MTDTCIHVPCASQEVSVEKSGAPLQPEFVEFTDDLGEVMNSQKVLSIVCSGTDFDFLKRQVDAALHSACRNRPAAEVADAAALMSLSRVKFSTTENISKFEDCTAVHDATPLVAVVDMDNDASYVCSLRAAPRELWQSRLSLFFDQCISGTCRKAKQGAPRPHDDVDPAYPHLCTAVQCSFGELVHGYDGDVFVILWSPHCPCCPEALRCMDAFIAAIREQDPSIRLRCVSCNVEENELDAPDWPTDTAEQVVPMIKLYVNCKDAAELAKHPCGGSGERAADRLNVAPTASAKKRCFKFSGKRNCETIMDFVVEHSTVLPASFSKSAAIEAWAQLKGKRKRE